MPDTHECQDEKCFECLKRERDALKDAERRRIENNREFLTRLLGVVFAYVGVSRKAKDVVEFLKS
jgi:hypothetical protein